MLIGIDGPDASGKTSLAAVLAGMVRTPTVLASADGFHRPRAIRNRRGSLSPAGYYADAFDVPALVSGLLVPFAAGATEVRTQVHDVLSDAPKGVVVDVPRSAILIVDGVFLLRPPLRQHWTYSVYLHVAAEETLRRVLVRDVELMGGEAAVKKRYAARYLPAQALYRADADPMAHADLVVDNTDPGAPCLVAG